MRKIKQYWLEVLIAASVMLVANWIFFTRPIFYTHDYLAGARVAEFTRGLLEGQLPVIWSGNFGWGYGMPLFEFYAPLPYAVGVILALMGMSLAWVAKGLFIIANVLTFIGAYLWAREFYNSKISALSAGFLTLASYRAMDIFARGATSEVWAIMALPWLFAGVTRLLRGEKYGYRITVFGGVCLALSHNITTMLVAPVVLGYVLLHNLCWERAEKKAALRKAIKSLIIAAVFIFGLSAFYVIPAFGEKNLTQVDTWILGDYFNFRIHFLYLRQFFTDNFGYGGSGWGPNDGLSFFLGWAQILSLLATCVLLLCQLLCNRCRWTKKIKSAWIFVGGIAVLLLMTMLMTTQKTQVIWESLSLLAFAQFPWRWVGISIVLVALVAPFGLTLLSQKKQAWAIAGLGVILLISSAHYWQGEKYLEEPSFYQSDPIYIREKMSGVLVDYLPRDFNNEWEAVPLETPVLNVEKQPEILVDRMHQKLYRFTDNETDSTVQLAIANYPGWTAEINGEPAEIITHESGNMEIVVPRGDFELGVKLEPTPLRLTANLITVVALVAAVGLMLL